MNEVCSKILEYVYLIGFVNVFDLYWSLRNIGIGRILVMFGRWLSC